jgi:hypothetical protein
MDQNTIMLYILIIFFVNIVPVNMQTITIEIDGLDSMITSSLDRLLGAIDPTIDKFQNTTIEILSVLEDRIKVNVSETLYWLETNLFLLLFAAIVFIITILILLNLLDSLLTKYNFGPEKRPFAGLAVITVICFWLFIAMVLSAWPPTSKFDLQTLQYVLVALLSLVVLFLIGVWIYCLYSNWNYIHNYFKTLCNRGKRSNIIRQGREPSDNEQL